MKRLLALLLAVPLARAHCPLCTAGAAVAAGGAAWLGVDAAAIGIFTGAFGGATGLWAARLLRRNRWQTAAITIASFLLTILPMAGLFQPQPFMISLLGEYGGILNRTYMLNTFIIGAAAGMGVLSASPRISRLVTRQRGKHIPYQGIIITFALLAAAATLAQIL